MNKLYVGSLPQDANEGALRELFQEHLGFQPKNVLVKKGGYAFVECQDQQSAERAIVTLNGFSYLGKQLVVEHSVSRGARNHTSKVIIRNLPSQFGSDALHKLLLNYGTTQSVDLGPDRSENTYSATVTYEAEDQAQQAFSNLNDSEVGGNIIKVEYIMEQGGKGQRNKGRPYGNRNEGQGPNMQRMGFRQSDFPLRILVLSDMVGAIIGKQGGTIRQITQSSHARVDVHRKDNVGSVEKPITIFGNPENCSAACVKILHVMQEEANNTNRGEIPLKILAHNNLIGRIIGKSGSTIKKIMEETDTKITVSSVHDVQSFNFERIITVKGSIDGMIKAETMISAKLRESYQNDLASMAPQSVMFPGLHPMAMMSTLGSGGYSQGGGRGGSYNYYQNSGNYMAPMYGSGSGSGSGGGGGGGGGGASSGAGSMHSSAQSEPNRETIFLYIPNPSVGAIIGTGGSAIREMISHSGASIKVGQPAKSEDPQQEKPNERKVTITGTPESQWKAQFMIFKKISYEGYSYTGSNEAKLRAEMLVPSNQVGRIIGKAGMRVRELQQVTKASIKLPDNSQQTPQSSQGTPAEETIVSITGDFYSSQAAQRQIRALVGRGQQPSVQQRQGGRGRDMGMQGPSPPRGPSSQ